MAAALVGALCLVGIALAASPPREWRQYPGIEYYEFDLPTDYQVPAEWTFARLMYPPYDTYRAFRRSWRSDWQTGGTSWTIDYPKERTGTSWRWCGGSPPSTRAPSSSP